MTVLEQQDLVALSRSNQKQGKLQFDVMGVVEDPTSVGRLIRAGVIKEDGVLTDAGQELLAKVLKAEKKLQVGIPFKRRTSADPAKIKEPSRRSWKTGRVGNQLVTTNSEIIFTGPSVLSTTKASIDLRKKLHPAVALALKGDFVEVWPHTFQIESLGGGGLVWLARKGQDGWVAIQAKYYDFLRAKFPTGRWYAVDGERPVQIRVKNKGWKNGVVALVQPIEVNKGVKLPTVRSDWGNGEKTMQD